MSNILYSTTFSSKEGKIYFEAPISLEAELPQDSSPCRSCPGRVAEEAAVQGAGNDARAAGASC